MNLTTLYNLNEQIYENSDKSIKIYKVHINIIVDQEKEIN